MNTIPNLIETEFQEASVLLKSFYTQPSNLLLIENASKIIVDCIEKGGKIISCGNGGSHCDAMHFAEELSGRYRNNRKALPAIAISDPSHISCVGNDYGFDYIFSRYLEGLGNYGDVLFGISTSGNSKNVINAVEAAKQKGMKIVLLTGKDGGALKSEGDVNIIVPHFGFADRIQEIHIKIIHILIMLIEKQLSL